MRSSFALVAIFVFAVASFGTTASEFVLDSDILQLGEEAIEVGENAGGDDGDDLDLMDCIKKADAEESERMKAQMESEDCERALATAQQNLNQANMKAATEDDLRQKAAAETKKALDDEQAAVAAAEIEKNNRVQFKEKCEAEIAAITTANEKATTDAQARLEKTKIESGSAADRTRAEALAQREAIAQKSVSDRVALVSSIQAQMQREVELVNQQKTARIEAAQANAAQQVATMQAQAAKAVQDAQDVANKAIQQLSETRDDTVAEATRARDKALDELADIQAQVLVVEKETARVEAARLSATQHATSYQAWAKDQLTTAKAKVLQALEIARSAAQMSEATVNQDTISATITAANTVTKQLEDQIAAAKAQDALANGAANVAPTE